MTTPTITPSPEQKPDQQDHRRNKPDVSAAALQQMMVASDLLGILETYIERFSLAPELLTQAVEQAGAADALASKAISGRIPYPTWCSILGELYALVDDPLMGLHIGQGVKPAHAGVLGYLVLSVDTALDALIQFERFQKLLYGEARGDTLGQATITEQQRLRFVWPQGHKIPNQSLSDEVLVFGLITFIKIMLGPEQAKVFEQYAPKSAIQFCHQATAELSAYDALGIGSIRFEQSELSVEVPLEALSLKVSQSDPALFALLSKQAEALLAVLPDGEDDFEQQLREYLRAQLPHGTPTLDNAATHLNMSSRTLHRRLEDRGMNFAALLREVRGALAKQYLDDNKLSLSEIAFMLGYSEQSAFSRAFKQWTGQTPRAYLKSS